MVPVTGIGKLLTACCCISGILVVTTPIPVIVNNFNSIREEQSKLATLATCRAKRDQRLLQMELNSTSISIHQEPS